MFATAWTRQPLLITKLDALMSGLWRYSRHPNHFGEQLFWWGLALFAVSSGDYWTLIGPLFNTVCMVSYGSLLYSITFACVFYTVLFYTVD